MHKKRPLLYFGLNVKIIAGTVMLEKLIKKSNILNGGKIWDTMR